MGLVSNVVCNPVTANFCETLANFTKIPDAMVLLMNGGAEAVEKAIKIARRWGYEQKGVPKDEAEIIVTNSNFHGRTMGVLSASAVPQYKSGFGPMLSGFRHVEFGSVESFLSQVNENTVAYLAEPIQGEGGFIFPPEGYWQKIREICDQKNILLVFDEIPTAFGRTGKDFPHEHYGIMPDVLILGKAIGGGIYPFSAVVGPEKIMSVLRPHDDGSTFGGNPIACAIGLEVIKILQKENLTARSRKLGELFLRLLKLIRSPFVKDVRGLGLFIGLELDPKWVKAEDFCLKLLSNGVFTTSARNNVVRFTPPLVILEPEIYNTFLAITKTLQFYHSVYGY